MCNMHNMAESEKETVEFPVVCYPVAREFPKGDNSFFFIYLYYSAV